MSLDPRFLTIHPATAEWFEQRKKCERCKNLHTAVEQGGNTVMRCRKTSNRTRPDAGGGYCIDARAAGQPCGPNAALFKEKRK